MVKCACCGITTEEFRRQYPFVARIVAENAYGLPTGKQFPFARRKEGSASPFPVLVRGNWPAYFHGREYQMRDEEVELRAPGVARTEGRG